MCCLGIWERNGMSLYRLVAQGIRTGGLRTALLQVDFENPPRYCDILLVAPSFLRQTEDELLLPCACHTVILPGLCALAAQGASQVVSYGFSGRDSLTASSMDDGTMFLALQRELVTVDGRRLERQEIPLRSGDRTGLVLAASGALLCAGLEPDKLALTYCPKIERQNIYIGMG